MKKILIDLDGPNISISSMETMPTKITPALKYVNVLPQGRWPERGGQKFGCALGHLDRECFP